MKEQSNFRIFWCQYLVEGVVLEKKVISVLLSFSGQKSLKSVFLDTLYTCTYVGLNSRT